MDWNPFGNNNASEQSRFGSAATTTPQNNTTRLFSSPAPSWQQQPQPQSGFGTATTASANKPFSWAQQQQQVPSQQQTFQWQPQQTETMDTGVANTSQQTQPCRATEASATISAARRPYVSFKIEDMAQIPPLVLLQFLIANDLDASRLHLSGCLLKGRDLLRSLATSGTDLRFQWDGYDCELDPTEQTLRLYYKPDRNFPALYSSLESLGQALGTLIRDTYKDQQRLYVPHKNEWRFCTEACLPKTQNSVQQGLSQDMAQDMLAKVQQESARAQLFLLHGPAGTGKTQTVMRLAGKLQEPLALLDGFSFLTLECDQQRLLLSTVPTRLCLLDDLDSHCKCPAWAEQGSCALGLCQCGSSLALLQLLRLLKHPTVAPGRVFFLCCQRYNPDTMRSLAKHCQIYKFQ
jgi:hypothetical protein